VPQVNIHDFRVTDRILAETEPDAADLVFIPARGTAAFPFVVLRKISGPGGVYIDAIDVIDADGTNLGTWERQFELDGASKPRTIITELRNIVFEHPGTYTVQYSIYDDVIASFPFNVVEGAASSATPAPGAGIVAGPLDQALSRSTIVWLSLTEPPQVDPHGSGQPVKQPRYNSGSEFPVWYGYENGRVFVLTGPGEQEIPGLDESSRIHLIARSKDKRSKIGEADASVVRLPKDTEWDRIASDLLVGRRLNLRDGDAAVKRWRETSEIYALTPLPPATPEERVEISLA
jgi:hypothetical protein